VNDPFSRWRPGSARAGQSAPQRWMIVAVLGARDKQGVGNPIPNTNQRLYTVGHTLATEIELRRNLIGWKYQIVGNRVIVSGAA
jgi:hypothetical protein